MGSNIRVEIGSRYIGPQLDRPALRRMPANWVLEEVRTTPAFWRLWFAGENLLMIFIAGVLGYAVGDALARML